MPKCVKIMLSGDEAQQLQFTQYFCTYNGKDWGQPIAQPGMVMRSLTVNDEEIQIQVYTTPNRNDVNYQAVCGELTKDAHIVLAVGQPNEHECADLNAYTANMKWWFKSVLDWLFPGDYIKNANVSGAKLPIFLIHAPKKYVGFLRTQFPVQTDELKVETDVINASVCEANPEYVCNVIARKIRLALQTNRILPREGKLTLSHLVAKPAERSQSNILQHISQFSGMLVGAILGIVAAIFIYNPLASVFAAASGLLKNKTFVDFLWFLISPIWGPLYGAFYKGLYLQGLRGWKEGFVQGFNALSEVSKAAALKEKTPISTRNIVASLLIIALSVAAVASVLIAPVSLMLSLPMVFTFLGLSGISTMWLAFLAGGAAMITATALYALGVQLSDYAFDCSLTGIKTRLPSNDSGTYQRLAGDGQPLAPAASSSATHNTVAVSPQSFPGDDVSRHVYNALMDTKRAYGASASSESGATTQEPDPAAGTGLPAPSTPKASGDKPEDAIGPKSVPPIGSTPAKAAAEQLQPSGRLDYSWEDLMHKTARHPERTADAAKAKDSQNQKPTATTVRPTT